MVEDMDHFDFERDMDRFDFETDMDRSDFVVGMAHFVADGNGVEGLSLGLNWVA